MHFLVLNNINAQVNTQQTDSLKNGFTVNATAPPPLDIDFNSSLVFTYDAAGNQTYRGYEVFLLVQGSIDTIISDGLNLHLEKDYLFKKDIAFFPNPVDDFLSLHINSEERVSELTVFDLNGKLLKDIKSNAGRDSFMLNFSEYPIGVYLVTLKFSSGKNETLKIIKK